MTTKNAPTTENVVAAIDRIKESKKQNIKILELLKVKCPEFMKWISPIFKRNFLWFNLNIEEISTITRENYDENTFKVIIFTERFEYYLTIRPDIESPGYLGCTTSSRKSLAGENWNRGRDLSDGNYSKETWDNILNDIIAHELVKLGQ